MSDREPHKSEEDDSKGDSSIKLFIGQVPRQMTEAELRKVFSPYGYVQDVLILRDRITGAHKGCAFLTYTTKESADKAILEVHHKITLHPTKRPVVVKYAGLEEPEDIKLFVGMLSKTTTDTQIKDLFRRFGDVKEVYLMRDNQMRSKGCAFVKVGSKEAATQAIAELHQIYQDEGSPSKLTVKFADTKQERVQRVFRQIAKQYPAPSAYAPYPVAGGSLLGVSGVSMSHPSMGGMATMSMHPAASRQPLAPTTAHHVQSQLHPFTLQPHPLSHQPQPQPQQALSHHSHQAPQQHHGGGGGGYGAGGAGGGSGSNGGSGAGEGGSYYSNSYAGYAMVYPSAPQLPRGPPGANVFIYNIPDNLPEPDLQNLFAAYGSVLSTTIFKDKNTGYSRGFGFVSYKSPRSAEKAIGSLNNYQLGGKRLQVQLKKGDLHDVDGYSNGGLSDGMVF